VEAEAPAETLVAVVVADPAVELDPAVDGVV